MNDRKLRIVFFLAVVATVMAVYLYSVAPTAAFWDCGELIAVSYIMGVPHPPGTPLFVTIGRIFSMLPLGREIAFRINFIPVLFGGISCGLIYLIVVKLIAAFAWADRSRLGPDGMPHGLTRWLPHASGIFAGLACAFAYSVWDNCVEAEVYGPCMVVALSVLYMALLWRDKVESGSGDNRLILAAIFLLFLATGIHFTPMMTVFAVLVFALVVDRESVLHLRIFEFIAGYLVILTATEMGLGVGMFVTIGLMLGAAYLGVRLLEVADHWWKLLAGLGLVFLPFFIGIVAAGNSIMDDTVLFLASPTVALIERWAKSPVAVILLAAGFAAYLYWLHRQGRLRPRYVGLMLGLVLLASTVQFVMLTRSRLRPSINEVDPSRWRDFVSVLKREQYDPMKLLPRKTQFLTENEWRMDENAVYSVPVAYFEQVKFYVRYFLWQWGNERFFDVFLRIRWQALLGMIPPLLGLWGMWHQFRRDKRSFVLIFVAFLVASLGLVTYLNLKYSPSDPRPQLKFREVRERDYFYAFSFVFYTIFVGVGAYAFLKSAQEWLRSRKLPTYAVSGALIAFAFVPMALNYRTVTRRYNWIPSEYGYNMLVSCPGEHAVLFTNGDNDTFPLWFVQTVPTRVAGFDPRFGKNVSVANLSLLNTNWYVKQMKRWGAPISFTEEQIDRLPQGFQGEGGRTFLLRDIMIRDIIATSAGIKLEWPQDYASTSQKFQAKVFSGSYNPKTPVYFATTVSKDNMVDVEPHVKLEGLVNRVVASGEENQVDVEQTRRLLYEVYQTKSMLDPRVEKDDNTRGLLINYAATYLALAGEYQRIGDTEAGLEVLEVAVRFPLDKERRIPLLYHASVFALIVGEFDKALGYLSEINSYGVTDPELTFRQALAYQGKGDLKKAEDLYRLTITADPSRSDAVQALHQLYLVEMFDTARARSLLEEWLRRTPGDTMAQRLLRQIS